MELDVPVQQLVETIHHLERDGCMTELRSFERLRLDFTDDFLAGMSTEQLRHVLLAACLQARKKPIRRTA